MSRAHPSDRACAPSGLSRQEASQAEPLVPCAANLQVGDLGFYCVCGEYYPARVVATGVRQSGGPVDEIIVYTKWGWRDVVARTTRGWCPFDNGSWIAAEHYEQVRAERRERAIAEFDGKWPAQGPMRPETIDNSNTKGVA